MTAINQKTVANDRSTGAHLLLAEIKGSQRTHTRTRTQTHIYVYTRTYKEGDEREREPCLEVHFINGLGRDRERKWMRGGGEGEEVEEGVKWRQRGG